MDLDALPFLSFVYLEQLHVPGDSNVLDVELWERTLRKCSQRAGSLTANFRYRGSIA